MSQIQSSKQSYPRVYTPFDTFAWVAEGTSVYGGVYEIKNAEAFHATVSYYFDHNGKPVKNSFAPFKDGDLILCTHNRLNDRGVIAHGRCEYVVLDEKDGYLVPRENAGIRTYGPIEQNAPGAAEYIKTLSPAEFEAVAEHVITLHKKQQLVDMGLPNRYQYQEPLLSLG